MDFSRFNSLSVEPAIQDFPGWTAPNERAFNHWYATKVYTSRGEIVDLGCMNGSSTVALASGLAANSRATGRKVRAFDRFIKSWPPIPGEPLEDIPQGGEFFSRFIETTAPWKERIEPSRCDIMTYKWSGKPIEFLLVDLMKSWDTAQVVVEQFFPWLLDRDALVVHQDFLHFYTPWIHLVMFRLRHSLSPVFEVPESCTIVFRKDGSLDFDACRHATDFDDVAADEVVETFAWSESIITKNSRAALQAAKAMFFCHYADRERKRTGSDQVASKWLERAITEYRAIQSEFSSHREVLRAGEFIERAASIPPPIEAVETGIQQTLSLGIYGGAMATLLNASEALIRVEIQRISQGPAWHVQLLGEPISVSNGHLYTVSLHARSESPRSINLLAVESSGSPIGLARTLDLDTEWREFRLEFLARKNEKNARLRFNLGSSDVTVELADVRFGPARIPLR